MLQGVTALTEGNDGSSLYPIGEHLREISNLAISPNWAVYVGHGTIRARVVGNDDREATPAELSALVGQAMQEGALGLSTGLFYVPGPFASTEEVIVLARAGQPHTAASTSRICATRRRDCLTPSERRSA